MERLHGKKVRIICEDCEYADLIREPSWLSGTRTEVTCMKRFARNFWGNEIHLVAYEDYEHSFPIKKCRFKKVRDLK